MGTSSAVDTRRTASIHRNVSLNTCRKTNNTLPRSAYHTSEKIMNQKPSDKVEVRLRSFSQNGRLAGARPERESEAHNSGGGSEVRHFQQQQNPGRNYSDTASHSSLSSAHSS